MKRQLHLITPETTRRLTDRPSDDRLRQLAQRLHPKFRPVWDGIPESKQRALAAYFLPWNSQKKQLAPTRPRVLGWYCPFAAQSVFPSGLRYCLNVYAGCTHGCEYCYAISYSSQKAHCKPHFERHLARDLAELDEFDVPPAPVHISNSTDPFQPLEKVHGKTRHALQCLSEYRHRFTTITILTKNPLLAINTGAIDAFRRLASLSSDHPCRQQFADNGHPPLQVQVSLAFWREQARQAYDVAAPSVPDRLAGIRALREAGIAVVLRIDPLFPRSPLPLADGGSLADFGLPEAQTMDDLRDLVSFAREVGVRHIVYSPAKIVVPRGRPLSATMKALHELYASISRPGKPIWRGGSWRLPRTLAQGQIVEPFLKICKAKRMRAKFCMQDLIEIP